MDKVSLMHAYLISIINPISKAAGTPNKQSCKYVTTCAQRRSSQPAATAAVATGVLKMPPVAASKLPPPAHI
jgi:hypothetical protein